MARTAMDNCYYVTDLDLRLNAKEALQAMGCWKNGRARPEHESLVTKLIEEAQPVLHPRGAYVVLDVDQRTDSELTLRGCRPFRGQIVKFLKPVQRVVAFVVTIGNDIEQLAKQRFESGSKVEGFTLDAIGSAAAESAVDALADAIYFEQANPDEAMTPPFCPGYCGLPMDDQLTIFSVVDAKTIGVKLLPSMLMTPLKSVAGFFGIGDSKQLEAHGLPCERCNQKTCKVHRA